MTWQLAVYISNSFLLKNNHNETKSWNHNIYKNINFFNGNMYVQVEGWPSLSRVLLFCVIRNFDLRLVFRRVRTLTMVCTKEAEINFLVEKHKGFPRGNIIYTIHLYNMYTTKGPRGNCLPTETASMWEPTLITIFTRRTLY